MIEGKNVTSGVEGEGGLGWVEQSSLNTPALPKNKIFIKKV